MYKKRILIRTITMIAFTILIWGLVSRINRDLESQKWVRETEIFLSTKQAEESDESETNDMETESARSSDVADRGNSYSVTTLSDGQKFIVPKEGYGTFGGN